MSKDNNAGLEYMNDKYSKDLHHLLLLYRQLNQLLTTLFDGYLIIPTDELNRHYLRVSIRIDRILEKPGFESFDEYEWKPFRNLLDLDPDAPDIDWEYGGQQICGNFLSMIEESFIKNGERTYIMDVNDQRYLDLIQTYIEEYRKYKRDYEKNWLQRVEEHTKAPKNAYNNILKKLEDYPRVHQSIRSAINKINDIDPEAPLESGDVGARQVREGVHQDLHRYRYHERWLRVRSLHQREVRGGGVRTG